jgi:hypothetical protein
MFLYETLLELPVEIYRGPIVPTLAALAQPQGELTTVDTPDPWLRERIEELRQTIRVDLVPAPEFVCLEGRVDLKRFSRYWSKAEKELLARSTRSLGASGMVRRLKSRPRPDRGGDEEARKPKANRAVRLEPS